MRALNVFKNSDLEISEICIHMETDAGEILEIDIESLILLKMKKSMKCT